MSCIKYIITLEADTVSLCGLSIIITGCYFELVTVSYSSQLSSSTVHANVIDRVYEQPKFYFWLRIRGCQ